MQKWLKLLLCDGTILVCVLLAGVPLPSFVLGEEHGRAGAVPVHARTSPDRPGPRSGGAAQNPRFPGSVSSGFPVRGEPHALRRNQGGHGPDRDLDIMDVPPLVAAYAPGVVS